MTAIFSAATVSVSPQQLQKVVDFYTRGLCLQAFEYSKTIGLLELWQGTQPRLATGRLAGNLGAPRLA